MLTTLRSALAACLLFAVVPLAVAQQEEFAGECEYAPDGPAELQVGVVECLRFDSEMMGGKAPFSYYIPPNCAPETGRRCPVFYWLHGLGGEYNHAGPNGIGERGQAEQPWVRALFSGPAELPDEVAEPWTLADPADWVEREAIDMILVTPHGQTLPGGYGPTPDSPKSTGWVDFNPRYAKDGEQPTYDTPPPRNASMIIRELIPYVEQHFPAIAGRSGRALGGVSYGSIGTGIIGLTYPDHFSSLLMMSGVGVVWPNPCSVEDPDFGSFSSPQESPFTAPAIGMQPYVDLYVDNQTLYLGAFGDGFTADNVYARAHHPPELLPNALSYNSGQQILDFEISVNDGIPRRPEDAEDPFNAVAAALEIGLAYTPAQFMEQDAQRLGVEHRYFEREGLHTGPYWQPYFRQWAELIYSKVQHWDGNGHAYPRPEVFNYRSIAKDFSVWEWQFLVDRPIDEFLNLTNVSCDEITLRGSGSVTLTIPEYCGTSKDGSREVVVDLGPSMPVNEPYGTGSCQSWGNSVTLSFEDADGDGLTGLADNCPAVNNPDQTDTDGDGIGDPCDVVEVDDSSDQSDQSGADTDTEADPLTPSTATSRSGGGGAVSLLWLILLLGVLVQRMRHKRGVNDAG